VFIAPRTVMAETALNWALDPNPGPSDPAAYSHWMLELPA
jgi:hypothetical protein